MCSSQCFFLCVFRCVSCGVGFVRVLYFFNRVGEYIVCFLLHFSVGVFNFGLFGCYFLFHPY